MTTLSEVYAMAGCTGGYDCEAEEHIDGCLSGDTYSARKNTTEEQS